MHINFLWKHKAHFQVPKYHVLALLFLKWQKLVHQHFVPKISIVSLKCKVGLCLYDFVFSSCRLKIFIINAFLYFFVCLLSAGQPGESSGTQLETFYDAQVKDGQRSSLGLVMEGKETDGFQTHQKLIGNSTVSKNDKSISLKQQKIVDEPKLMSSASEPSTEYSKCIGSLSTEANGSGDLNEKESSPRTSTKGKKRRDIRAQQHIPGIGPVVDAVQLQAVIDYLEGTLLCTHMIKFCFL